MRTLTEITTAEADECLGGFFVLGGKKKARNQMRKAECGMRITEGERPATAGKLPLSWE